MGWYSAIEVANGLEMRFSFVIGFFEMFGNIFPNNYVDYYPMKIKKDNKKR